MKFPGDRADEEEIAMNGGVVVEGHDTRSFGANPTGRPASSAVG
jgi:hypothetical protein